MSNLGWYQIATTISKKVGGPLQLAGILVGLGAAIGVSGYKTFDVIRKKREEAKNSRVYHFNDDVEAIDGIIITSGTEFIVLDRDKDAVLVDIKGIDNNPYFLSYSLLKDKTDYS